MSDMMFWASMAKLMLALPVVAALAYLSLRMTASISGNNGQGRTIEVIEKKTLAKNQSLYVVKAGGRYHLMAGSEQALIFIRDLEPDEIRRPQVGETEALRFKSILTQAAAKVRRS